MDLVWAEQPPRTAAKTLQSYVTRLRKGLGSDAIVRIGAAYRLDVAADAVDVARFKRHLDAGDIDAALAEWTDPPLAGLDAPGLTAVADALVEQWLGAVERDLDPDHALLRYTHAYLYEDSPALHRWSPEAVAWLRRHGEDHLAALTELAGVASGLMSSGRFEEFDTLVTGLADRYRTEGPPTLLSLALIGLGYSASFQGKLVEADAHFDELGRLALPERTFSVHGPIAARAAFRRGNRMQAFQLLRTHVDELLETDNTDVARLACVEFVNMMATMGRMPDAERVMGYLETTGGFGALASRTLVADAAGRIAKHRRHQERGSGPDPDAHHALTFMRDVLHELDDDQQIAPGPHRRRRHGPAPGHTHVG